MSTVVKISPKTKSALEPTSLAEAMQLSEMLANSSIVPNDYQGKPGNVLVAIQWGQEIGLQPLQSMQSIAVINGRPSIWGDAMLALVRSSGLLESIEEDVEDDVATCTVKRKGEDLVTRQFAMDDAKIAGLAGKQGPWKQYPKRMLQLRARAFALRDVFTDVLRGVHIAEEAQDMPPMKDVTPKDEKPVKGAAGVKEKLKTRRKAKAKEEPVVDEKDTVDLKDVLAKIEEAETEGDLKPIAADCAKLDNGDKDKARTAYAAKLASVRPVDYDTLKETILTEIENGAPADAAMDFYAEQIDKLTEEQRLDLDAMIAEGA